MEPTPSSIPTSRFPAYISSYTAPIQPAVTPTTALWSKADPPPPTRSNTFNGSTTVKDTVGTLFGLTRCGNTWPSVSGAGATAVLSRAMSSLRAFNVNPGRASHTHKKVRVRQDSRHQSRTESSGTAIDTAKDDDKSDDAVTTVVPEERYQYYSFPPYLTDAERAAK